MRKLYEKERKIWHYSFIIVAVSLLSSIFIFFVSFNIINEVFPANSYSNGYYVKFQEHGLPENTTWGITLNGTSKYSNSTSIIFNVQNGSYIFTVNYTAGYVPSPESGNVTVNGTNVTVQIVFRT